MFCNILIGFLFVFIVVVCGILQECCISCNISEYCIVVRFLVEVEGNLVCGYVWEECQIICIEWDDCFYVVCGKDGEWWVLYWFCLCDVVDIEWYCVLIDFVVEICKCDNFEVCKMVLLCFVVCVVDVCKVVYFEDVV